MTTIQMIPSINFMQAPNAFFTEALLIVHSLLDYKDKKVISICRHPIYKSRSKASLEPIRKKFISTRLQRARNEIIAHQAKENESLYARRTGMVYIDTIIDLENIIQELITEFNECAKEFNEPYAPNYFQTSETEKEIMIVMKRLQPILRNHYQ